MKILKGVLGVLAALVLLSGLAIVALLLLVDLNDYKKELEQLAAQQNVELHIEGDLGWSFYPNLALRTGRVTVRPPLELLSEPVAFDGLRVGIQLKPLWHRQVKTSEVKVSGGSAVLKTADSQEVTRIQNLSLTAQSFNLQQQPFDLSLALEMTGESPAGNAPSSRINQRVVLRSDLRLSLDSAFTTVHILGSHHTVHYTGDALPQPAEITAEFSGQVNLDDSIADLKPFRLTVDDTTLEGAVKANYSSKPFYTVNLKGNRIDVDRYTAPASAPADAHKDSASDSPVVPAATVLAFPGNYDFAFDRLTIQRLSFTDMAVHMKITPEGVMTVQPLKLHGYDGDIAVEATVDVRGQQPVVQSRVTVTPLQIEPALKDFLQQDKVFASGDFAFASTVSTRGITVDDFLKALSGNFNFASKSITLNEVDITSSLNTTLLQLLQTKLPALMSEGNKTVMTDLDGKGDIQQGRVAPHLHAKMLCSSLEANGTYDLPTSAVDMRVAITFPSADTAPACAEVNPRLKDIAWPVTCRGTLEDDPSSLCVADKAAIEKMAKQAVKKEVNRKLEDKVSKKLDEKLGKDAEQVKGLLKGLLNK